ncbi:putative bifunctional diguanylate cyclase/phosphodiesterase [Desulfogranum mediterraneum]|uniref:putative bifunctional diguanylate cyclase/phosphodiesterase n=1 Tax=Desulfogranum mediterraneum TaxID=160661 RepID=UPI000426D5D1|nr:EAL domain-containing protein [Desulfogranum mediterraneum]
MKLNKRLPLLILPVLFTSYLVIALGLYLVERSSIYSLAQSSIDLEATELAGYFTQYSLVTKGLLGSILQSDALHHFLDTDDDHLKSLAISSGLNGILNTVSGFSSDHLSITFVRGDGKLEYYYENSLDPFSTPAPQIQDWARQLLSERRSSASRYYPTRTRLAFCLIRDRFTLKPPLSYDSPDTMAIIVETSPSQFKSRSDALNAQNRTLTFWPESALLPAQGTLEARRSLTGFGTLALSLDKKEVESSLRKVSLRLCLGFLLMLILSQLSLQYLLRRYVIRPINNLEGQLAGLDLNTPQKIVPLDSDDEIGSLGRAFAALYQKLQETYEGTKKLAERDTLTALYNRRIFQLLFQKLLTRAEQSGEQVALFYIDIDNFKYVNDQFGHSAGDALLKNFALRLHASVRGSDLILNAGTTAQDNAVTARLAGDEFAVIVHGYNDEGTPGKVARRIVEICENGFQCDDTIFPVTLSVGVATYPQDGRTPDELTTNADAAMYLSKKSGKNTISFYSQELATYARRQQGLEIALKQMDPGELELCYMPIIESSIGQVYAFEALLRWSPPGLGQVSPAEFIPLAESLGLCTKIDLWAIEQAFADLTLLQERFGEQVKVAINISATELGQQGFELHLNSLLEQYRLRAETVILEITETFYQNPVHSDQQGLHALRQLGLQLAIDDLGSGHTSLLQLVEFPVNMVKIDQLFINKTLNSGNLKGLRALIDFCHAQDLLVSAEGVESSNDAQILKEAGCDYLQGFYYSKPQALADLLAAAIEEPGKAGQAFQALVPRS